MANSTPWWKAPKGEVHKNVIEYVGTLERNQSEFYDRFVKLEALYDPNSPIAGERTGTGEIGHVTENVVASTIDTVAAAVATTEVRARFPTDDADWSTQRLFRHLEFYAEGLGKQLKVHRKCRKAFGEAAKKGVGLLKVTRDDLAECRVSIEQVPIDDIVVDDRECRDGGQPQQIHHLQRDVDREHLKARFPRHAERIDSLSGAGKLRWSGYRGGSDQSVAVCESWRLPIGRKPKGKEKGSYVAGRHTITANGVDLLDEAYHKPFFPFPMIVWSTRTGSFYGISLAERIAGIQRALNRRNWQIERTLDQNAVLTTYVRPADAAMTVKTNRIGAIAVVRGDMPVTPNPPVVSGETYQSRIDLKNAAFEESGVSRLAAQSHKPAGLDSGAALREYRDQTTQRFAPQEQDFEQLVLDTIWLMIDVCRDLRTEAPTIMTTAKFGSRRIPWSKVDMGDVRVQIAAASALARTPAGRMQTVLEWAQAGVITQDEARRLLRHPDLERAMSLYTASLESIENQLEMILDGEIVVPEPFDNLKMIVWRGTAEYHNVRQMPGAPEEVLEALRQYTVQAAYMFSKQQAAAADPAAAGPAAPMSGTTPMMPPTDGSPTAAFAAQAMDTRAG